MRQYLFPIIAFSLVSVLFVIVEVSRPKVVDWTESYSMNDKNPYGSYILFERLKDFNGNNPINVSEKSIFEELEFKEGNYFITSKKEASKYKYENDEYGSNIISETVVDSITDSSLLQKDSIPLTADTLNDTQSSAKHPAFYVDTTLTTPCEKCTTYFFVNGTLTPDKFETEMLLKFVAEGNTVVIASSELGGHFYDSLGITNRYNYGKNEFFNDSIQRLVSIHFYPKINKVNQSIFTISERRIKFDSYLYSIDSNYTSVIASKGDTLPIAMKVQHGRGIFLLVSSPQLFTNYGIVKPESNKLITSILTLLPKNMVLWSNYYKFNRTNVSSSPLRYILSQEGLRWAYYLFLIVSSVYIIFSIKRTQRAIPIVKPYSNDTLDFVNTIGTLFFQSKDHRLIALKKIQYFFDFLRTNYYLNTSKFDKDFFEKASLKLQISMEDTISLFSKINGVLESDTIEEEEMKQLVLKIDSLIAFGNGTKKAIV